ncbi:hypothetical protein [Nitrosospira sp. Nsp13]|uniref:hypothetical protein n=1 Tax=Nitrosospira sp. Nsp13 TaxID=1855332 RepID=UPI0008844644|nr:hypothetical protein [Nitrosospira sp. Nsp13]SCY38916.1 hypothetical protein SAMN05216308_109123 [Nitrosospira sp. Nsp13]
MLFLLSLLVHLQDRKRTALIAGTFVLVSGAVYYAFMAAYLNLFLIIGFSTILRLTLGSGVGVNLFSWTVAGLIELPRNGRYSLTS